MSEADRLNIAGWAGVAVLTVLACALSWSWTPEMTILGDEWRYAEWTSTEGALQRGFDPDVGKYSIPVPLVVYQGLFEVFGIESHVPFRLMSFVLLAVVACALFELLRRRVGSIAALPAVALVLFLGTSAEVLATSLRSPAMMSLAASLLALLALERKTVRFDLLAMVLLVIAVACHPGGLAFCAAAAVIVLFRPAASLRDRALGSWVFAVPLLLFLLVLRPAPADREGAPSLTERAAEAPEYLADGVAGLLSRVAGVAEGDLVSLGALQGDGSAVGWALAAVLVAACVAAFVSRPESRPGILAFSACTLILVGAALLAPGGTREPNLERYVLPSAVALLLLIAELARGADWRGLLREPRGRIAIAFAGALMAFAILSNAATLERRAGTLDDSALALKAEALAYDLARDLDPVTPEEWEAVNDELKASVGRHRFPLSPAQYYGVADDYGTPALGLDELQSHSPRLRQTVAAVLQGAATAPIPPELRVELEESS